MTHLLTAEFTEMTSPLLECEEVTVPAHDEPLQQLSPEDQRVPWGKRGLGWIVGFGALSIKFSVLIILLAIAASTPFSNGHLWDTCSKWRPGWPKGVLGVNCCRDVV